MKIENCKCGAVAEIWSSYCTAAGMGHGHVVRCKGEHYGPWAKTPKGAIRTWNQFQRSELTLEQTILARGVGYTFQKAMSRFGRAL